MYMLNFTHQMTIRICTVSTSKAMMKIVPGTRAAHVLSISAVRYSSSNPNYGSVPARSTRSPSNERQKGARTIHLEHSSPKWPADQLEVFTED